MPDRVIDLEPDKPTEQKVVVELLNEQPLRADGVQRLEQQRPDQSLRRDRGPTRVGVHRVQLFGDGLKQLVNQGADLAQRVVGRYAEFRADIAEQVLLTNVFAARPSTSCSASNDPFYDTGTPGFSAAC